MFILVLFCCCYYAKAQEGNGGRDTSSEKIVIFNGNRNFPPFEFINDHGKPDGFDVDLISTIFRRLNLRYRIEMKEWKTVMGNLDSGKVDVATLMYSNSRAKKYDFGPIVKFTSLYAVYADVEKPVNSLKDFAGKRVVVEKGTLSEEMIRDYGIACRLTYVSNIIDGLRGVSDGKYDLTLCSSDVAQYNIRKFNIQNLKTKDIGIAPSELCFAGTDEKLQTQIENALYEIKQDGTYDKIYDKWFSLQNGARASRVVYIVIAGLLLTVFILYILIYVLRSKVYSARRILRDNNDKLKLALSAGGIIVWGYDVRRARYYNVECDIFPPEGRTIDEEVAYFHPDDQERYREVITKAIGGIQPSPSLCFRIDYTRTGHWVYIEKEITLVRSSYGIVTHLIGTHKDITEKVKHTAEMMEAQHELEREMAKAKEADRLKSEFLANMSHEIRTPLNSIVGFSSMLKEDIGSDDRDMCIHLIEKNTDMLIRLVNDILDFSKLEAGACDFRITTFNLSELMDVAYSSLLSLSDDTDVKLILDVPQDTCMVTSDYSRIQQIVTNFVTNAFKYTDHGHVKLGYQRVADGIRIYVEDTGIGIPEENRAMVFNRFEKLGSLKQGTGLGLSICKSIVEQFGGTIGVDSTLGVGSTFWVCLPLRCECK